MYPRLYVAAPLLLGLVLVSPAHAGEWTCPRAVMERGERLPLTSASVWAGDEELDPQDAEEYKHSYNHYWSRWQIRNYTLPRLIACRYGFEKVYHLDPKITVPIPDDATTCELDARARNTAGTRWDIGKISCVADAVNTGHVYRAEIPDWQTELGGMTLSMTKVELFAYVAVHGGSAVDGNANPFLVAFGDRKYLVHFIPDTGRVGEIVALLPPQKDGSLDLYYSLVMRFGTQTYMMAGVGQFWAGRDGIGVEYWHGRPGDPQEIHLIAPSFRKAGIGAPR
jgi:hypothetical protein